MYATIYIERLANYIVFLNFELTHHDKNNTKQRISMVYMKLCGLLWTFWFQRKSLQKSLQTLNPVFLEVYCVLFIVSKCHTEPSFKE